MASRLSESLSLICRLEESARQGDWTRAGELSAALRRQAVPDSREELAEYLGCLKRALITAKISRAHSAASLVRLNAAARFNGNRAEPAATRHKFGGLTNF